MPREWDENGNLITEAPVREWDEAGKLIEPTGGSVPQRKTLKLQGAQLSVQPKPSGMLATAEKWLGDAASDIREGTDSTIIGKGLRSLGAKGTNYGNSAAVGDYMASPILGPIRMARGIMQVPQGKIIEGAKNIGGGALDAAQIPASFMGGHGASAAANKINNVIPSAKRAAVNFDTVAKSANTIPIDTAAARKVALEANDLSEHGAPTQRIFSKFLEKSDPLAAPMTFESGRKFAVNAGPLSVSEGNRLTPVMERQVARLADALATANRDAAAQAGVVREYDAAMKEYRQAQQLKSGLKTAAKIGAGGAAAALGGGWAIHAARTALGL